MTLDLWILIVAAFWVGSIVTRDARSRVKP